MDQRPLHGEDFVETGAKKCPRFAMTIDVEEWFTGVADAPDKVHRFDSRLHVGMRRVLDLLDETSTRATFFFLGYLAEQQPQWVAEVARRGHEIGCHGLYHRPLWDMTPREFMADVSRARMALLDAGAPRVDGFRAPLFSIRADTFWAEAALEDLGFRYSSSVFPIRNPRYGFPQAPRFPFLTTRSGRFVEFPISTLAAGGVRLPFSGGFYLRALPARLVEIAFAELRARHSPGVCYVHPWELDPEQPLLPVTPLTRARRRIGLATTRSKLEALLRAFDFAPMADVLNTVLARPLQRWGLARPAHRET
jgi:polysaccharide deacetylase family protein (PEP-CTERM system associated)